MASPGPDYGLREVARRELGPDYEYDGFYSFQHDSVRLDLKRDSMSWRYKGKDFNEDAWNSGYFVGSVQCSVAEEVILFGMTAGIQHLDDIRYVNHFDDFKNVRALDLSGESRIVGLLDDAPERGLTFVGENLGTPRSAAMRAARDFEAGTVGAFSDVATQQRMVPALRFNNPNPNGAGFVKFDGFSLLDDGVVELIDAKTRLVPFSTRRGPFVSSSVRDGLVRKSLAIKQNPGYHAVLELPNEAVRREAQQVLRQLRIKNISTRVRKR